MMRKYPAPDFGRIEKISVVCPVYGCRDCLHTLSERVETTFNNIDLDWELILIDDRSPDQPWEVIEELAKKNPCIRGVRLSRNHGQHIAIWAGLEAATGDYVAVIDCDLQDDPNYIPILYNELKREAVDAMIVNRGSWSDSLFRRVSSKCFYAIVKLLTGVEIKNIGNFGLYSRRLVNILLLFKEQEVFLPIMISLAGLPSAQYTIPRADRHAGGSSYSLRRLITLSIAIIIRFTDRPLKLSVIVGLIFSSLSALISVCLLVMWLLNAFTVPGWTSTILSLWFLSGIIMATLGIHGFYLGRVFREVQRRPRILIEQTTDERDTSS